MIIYMYNTFYIPYFSHELHAVCPFDFSENASKFKFLFLHQNAKAHPCLAFLEYALLIVLIFQHSEQQKRSLGKFVQRVQHQQVYF